MRNLRTGRRILLNVTGVALAAYMVLVMFTNLPLWLFAAGAIGNAAVFDLVIIAGVALLVVLTPGNWKGFLVEPYVWWIGALALVFAINFWRLHYVESLVDMEEFYVAENRVQRVVLMLAYAYAAYVIGKQRFHLPLVLALIGGSVVLILDFFLPDLLAAADTKIGSGRADGFYMNANGAAEASLLGLLLVYRRMHRAWLIPLYVLVGIGILLTFSRGGLVCWLLLGGVLFVEGRLSRWFLLAPVAMVLFYSTFLIYAEDMLMQIFDNRSQVENMVDRLAFFSEVGENQLDDSSAASRVELARSIFWESLSKPILGHVRAAQYVYGTEAHNLLLAYWYPFGLPGLLLCFSMVYLLQRRREHRFMRLVTPEAMIFGLLLFLNHLQFETNFWFLFYALVFCGERRADSSPATAPIDVGAAVADWRNSRRRRARRRRRSQPAGSWRGRFG